MENPSHQLFSADIIDYSNIGNSYNTFTGNHQIQLIFNNNGPSMSEIDNKPILLSPVELNDVNHHQFQQPQFCCPPMETLNFFEGHHHHQNHHQNSQIMLPNQTNGSSSSSSCTSSPINTPTSLITINTSSINNANVAPNSILIRQFPSPPTSPSSEKQLSVVAQSPAIKHETNPDEDYEKEIADDGTYIKQEQDDTIISNLINDDSDDSSNHRHQQQLDFLSINPKQRNRIIKRRFARERFEKKHGFSKQRKPYIHESRHVHALRRPRGPGGRFLNANQMAEIEERRNSLETVNSDSLSETSNPTSDVRNNNNINNDNNDSLYSPTEENVHTPTDGNFDFNFVNTAATNINSVNGDFYDCNNNININTNLNYPPIFVGGPDITTIDGYSYQPQLISLPSSSSLSIQTAPMTPITPMTPFQTHSPYHTQQSFQQQQLSPCSPGFQGIDYNNNSGYLLEQSNHFDHQLYNTVVPSSFAEYACDNEGGFY